MYHYFIYNSIIILYSQISTKSTLENFSKKSESPTRYFQILTIQNDARALLNDGNLVASRLFRIFEKFTVL